MAGKVDHFPDSRIGASLKPHSQRREPLVRPYFPDSRIGASLKQCGPAEALAAAPTSPIRESGPH